jgi:hypothetical protein
MLKTVGNPSVRSGDQTILNGNLVIGTAGNGVDFAITSEGTGVMTSELFDDYEEGGFTPTDASGAGLIFVAATGRYTKIGRLVCVHIQAQYPGTVDVTAASIGGLPFAAASNPVAQGGSWGFTNGSGAEQCLLLASGTSIAVHSETGSAVTNALMSNTFNYISFYYITNT